MLHQESGIVCSHILPLIRQQSKIKPTGRYAGAEPLSSVTHTHTQQHSLEEKINRLSLERRVTPHYLALSAVSLFNLWTPMRQMTTNL